MSHFIWVFIVCQSTSLWVSSKKGLKSVVSGKRVKKCHFFFTFENWLRLADKKNLKELALGQTWTIFLLVLLLFSYLCDQHNINVIELLAILIATGGLNCHFE